MTCRAQFYKTILSLMHPGNSIMSHHPRQSSAPSAKERRSTRLHRLLTYHFDLEILHKHRELRLLELELQRGREVRVCLEKLMLNEVVYPDRYTRAEYAAFAVPLTLSTNNNVNNNNSNTGNLKRAISMPGLTSLSDSQHKLHHPNYAASTPDSRHQYEMRADGSIVRLRCPVCGADKFKSMLGFLNHCRIHCHVVFTSPEDRQQRAGVHVDPSTVPADFFARHPTMVKQQQDLAMIRSDLQPLYFDATPPLLTLHSPDPLKGQPGEPLEEHLLNGSEPLIGEVTRFCIHKRLVVGNDTRCLQQPTPAAAGFNTHQWRVYLRAPPRNSSGQRDVLGKWIRSVRFFLHPSYPERIVDVSKEPFELVRDAFGEFPVRIQLHFWDSARNPPFDIIHHIKIFQAVNPGKLVGGPERLSEIELDRATDFSLAFTGGNASMSDYPLPSSPHSSDYEVLNQALARTKAVDIMHGNNASEIERAKLMHCESIRENIRLRNAVFCLSANEILSWLSMHRRDYFLIDMQLAGVNALSVDNPQSVRYCCYCGQCHEPAARFEILQKNCSFKPRKVRLSSRSDLSGYVLGRYSLSDTPLIDDHSRYSLGKNVESTNIKLESALIPHYPQTLTQSMIITPHEDRMGVDSKIVCNILIGIFAKRLVARSISSANATGTRPVLFSPSPGVDSVVKKSVVLTPLHVYSALSSDSTQTLVDNTMDFIILENMQA